jgi:hypothetical protein
VLDVLPCAAGCLDPRPVAAMAAAWLRLREGAPDPHTQAAGLLMLAATNEQVTRINDTV